MSIAYSVVIPAFNAAATIGQAIGSVLAQSVPPAAIIVVDDGSTDATGALAQAMGDAVLVVRRGNGGPGAATTEGFRRVSTPFVATLDADDLWLPGKIARQARCFEFESALAGAFSLARLFRDGDTPGRAEEGPVRPLWTRTTMLYRTEAARDIGDFVDLPGRLGEVVDWLSRGRELSHRHVMVDEVLALRRIRPGSLSYGVDAERGRGYLAAVHAALERRKRSAGPDERDGA